MGLILFLLAWIGIAQGEATAGEAFLGTLMLIGLVDLARRAIAMPLLRLALILFGVGVLLSGCDDDA